MRASSGRALFATCALVIGVGCGNDLAGDGGGLTAGLTCERDRVLVESNITCTATASCPCGTRCEFGRCRADCVDDRDCGEGERCGEFGECVSAGFDVRSSRPSGADNFVRVAPSELTFTGFDRDLQLTVAKGNVEASTKVVVEALDGGARVRCPGSNTFDEACDLLLTDDTPARNVDVRSIALEGDAELLNPVVRVSTRYRQVFVPITIEPSATDLAQLEPGVYLGVAAASAVLGDTPVSEETVVPLSIEVEVHVVEDGEGRYSIAVRDPLELFRPAAVTDAPSNTAPLVRLGELVEMTPGIYSVQDTVPSRYIQGQLLGDVFELGVRHRLRAIEPLNGGRLAFEIIQTVDTDGTVGLVWEVSVDRSFVGTPQSSSAPMAAAPVVSSSVRPTVEGILSSRFPSILSRSVSNYAKAQDTACGDGGTPQRFAQALGAVREIGLTNQEERRVRFDGELACRSSLSDDDELDDDQNTQLPLFPIFGQPDIDPARYTDVINQCLSEMRAFATTGTVSGTPTCVDVDRWLMTQYFNLDEFDGTSPEAVQSQRLGAYLFTRFLDIHGFVTETYRVEEGHRRAMDSVLDSVSSLPTYAATLRQTIEHWDVLLHPDHLFTLLELPAEVLVRPDYRLDQLSEEDLVLASSFDDIQATPVSEAIFHDLVDQSNFWRTTTERFLQGGITTDGVERELRVSLRRGYRRALILYSLATRLDVRRQALEAILVTEEDDLFDRFNDLLPSLGRNLAENLTATANMLLTKASTFQDRAIPWAPVGDVTGTGAQYRALSQRMLGSSAELGGVVGAALLEADRAFDLATDAYRRYRLETIRLRFIRDFSQDRLDYIANDVGAKVVEACGYDVDRPIDGYAIFQAEIDPASCFVDETCQIESQPSEPLARYRLCKSAFLAHYFRQKGVVPEALDFPVRPDDGQEGFRAFFLDADLALSVEEADVFTFDETEYLFSQLDYFDDFARAEGLAAKQFADADVMCRPVFDRATMAEESLTCTPPSVSFCNLEGGDPTACADGAGPNDPSALDFDAGSCSANAASPDLLLSANISQCVRGSLGVAYRKVLEAQADLEKERAKIRELQDKYKVDSASCEIIVARAEAVTATYDEYLTTVRGMREELKALNRASAVLSAMAECIATTGDLFATADAAFLARAPKPEPPVDDRRPPRAVPQTDADVKRYNPPYDANNDLRRVDPPCTSGATCGSRNALREANLAHNDKVQRAYSQRKAAYAKRFKDYATKLQKWETAFKRVNVTDAGKAPGPTNGNTANANRARRAGLKGAGLCALRSTAANLEADIFAKERDIDQAQDDLEANIANLKEQAEVDICFNALNRNVAAFKPALAALEAAAARLTVASQQFEEKKANTTLLHAQGRVWEANLLRRRATAIPQDYGYRRFFDELDDKLERLREALESANRAVEFELQKRVLDPLEIRSAADLETLRSLAYQLRDAVISGRIQGGSPTAGRLVLSVKNDLLGLRPIEATGFQGQSTEDQLRAFLTDPQFAVYDESGAYRGQSIPFSLSPDSLTEGAVSLNEVSGEFLCGERVWSVGAVIAGRDAVSADARRSIPLFLKKRNRFSIRRCTPEAELFDGFAAPLSLDPSLNEEPITRNGFATAWLNSLLYRTNFDAQVGGRAELGALATNQTTELAGLGLYGDYELFVPAMSFAEDGIQLSGLSDIFLVFDLVAVSNTSRF